MTHCISIILCVHGPSATLLKALVKERSTSWFSWKLVCVSNECVSQQKQRKTYSENFIRLTFVKLWTFKKIQIHIFRHFWQLQSKSLFITQLAIKFRFNASDYMQLCRIYIIAKNRHLVPYLEFIMSSATIADLNISSVGRTTVKFLC